jgi:DNA-binding NtrC family response regulator
MDILIIEDEPVVAQLMAEVMTEAGHRSYVFDSLEAVPANSAPDLVISDLLPLRDFTPDGARAWVRALLARFPGTPLILCTAHLEASRHSDALGASAVVMKPFDVDHLKDTVRRLLA